MRLSFSWLNEYLQLKDSSEIAEYALTLPETLTEVDGIDSISPKFHNVYIGKILSIKDHPNSDKLHIVQVDSGHGIFQIVCGASNIHEGMIVPVTLAGSIIYDEDGQELIIAKTKIRGEESEGMLCSSRELGISNDHSGILDLTLDKSLKVGELLDPIFTDQVLKIENKAITHRPDCFSHIGVARELAAIIGKKITIPPYETENISNLEGKLISDDQKVLSNPLFKLENEICLKVDGFTRRYSTITIKGINIAPSPAWLQSRLIALGHKPINNIVDLTNYIMYAIGQPLHAFDADITGYNFHIRTGKKGEKITTLDKIEHELTSDDISITDGERPLDIGGIIGGLETGINPNTKNIVLVADNFDPAMLRRTSWSLGIRTDAVTIYEKDIDPNLTINGLVAFVNLYNRIYPEQDAQVSSILDYYPTPLPEFKKIAISKELIDGTVGIKIPLKRIREILTSLGIVIEEEEGGIFNLLVPSRRTDIKGKEDVIEEVIRLYRYSKLPVKQYFYKLNDVSDYPGRSEELSILNFLANNGFMQIEPYMFASSKEEVTLNLGKNAVVIKNPITIDDDILKTSAVPELAHIVHFNERYIDEGRFFSLTRIFERVGGTAHEKKMLSAIIFSKSLSKQELYQNLLTTLINSLKYMKIEERMIELQVPSKSKDEINDKIVDSKIAVNVYIKGEYAGYIGILSGLSEEADLSSTTAVFTISWASIINNINRNSQMVPYSHFPSSIYDISFYIDTTINASDVLRHVKTLDIKYLKNASIIDTFEKDETTRSITLRLIFNDFTKTLESLDLEKEVEKIGNSLKEKFSKEHFRAR